MILVKCSVARYDQSHMNTRQAEALNAKRHKPQPREYIKAAHLTLRQDARADRLNEHVQRNPYGAARRLIWLEDRLVEMQQDLAKAAASEGKKK